MRQNPAHGSRAGNPGILFLATEDWYFAAHRLGLAKAAVKEGYVVSVATRVRDHARAIADAGVTLLTLDWSRRSVNPMTVRDEVAAVRAFIADQAPGILHCVSLRPVVIACLALRGLPRQRVVLAFTGLGYLFVGSALWKNALRRIVARVIAATARVHDVALLFENTDDRNIIMDLTRLDAGLAHVNPGSGVDILHFSPLPPPDGDVPVFGFAGRMLTIKGVEDLIAASRLLDRRKLAHRVLLAGPVDADNRAGITKERLEALIAGSSVTWLGALGDVRDLWRQSDVAVLASHGGEGVPLSLIEAAACGRPVITSDVPGCRDVVCGGDCGILVAPRDPEELADVMAALAGDDALRDRMAGQAASCAARFSSDVVNTRTLALYARLGAKP